MESAIQTLAQRLRTHGETIATEEAVKTSVVLPFLQAIGYDVFNPGEVIPEFTADVVGKRGEKVDYAVAIDGEIKILVECKGLHTELEDKHLAQLFRYFTVTNARFGLLTNGRLYKFYTDLDEPNKLDRKPFLSFDILDYSKSALTELRKFEKSNFDIEGILRNAERLKYVSAVKKYLVKEMEDPSPELIKVIASDVHDGRVTAHVRDLIAAATKSAFQELVGDAVRTRLSSALEKTVEPETDVENASESDDVVTTDEEIEATLLIRGIVRSVIDGQRVGYRDAKSYCAVLLDDNNRKPLARLHFNRKQKYLGLFDKGAEDRVPINDLSDIYEYSERLRSTATSYS